MKILITADIHIHDYPNYNLFDDPKFRLNQFNKLSYRLLDIYEQEKCSAFFIAGDLLHTSNPRPYVTNTVYNFLKKLNEDGPIYITHGQHDLDSRKEISVDDTLLQIFSDMEAVTYLHKDSVKFEDIVFYFYGWEPEFEPDYPFEDNVVLIGHHTVVGSKITQKNSILKEGHEIDTSFLRYAFLGDIHYHQVKDNLVIVGAPIQHNFGDFPDVGVIIFDTETLSWYRVKTNNEDWKFLRFLVTNDPIKDEWTVTKEEITKNKLVEAIDTHVVNIREHFDFCARENNLEDLHKEILSSILAHESLYSDLRFRLLSINIQNFKSIKELSFDFSSGINLVIGENGTGKSALMEAFVFGLVGNLDARKVCGKNSKEMCIEISLEFQNNVYRIIRGWKGSGFIEFYINDEEQKAENQTKIKEQILEHLDFLNLVDLFYHDQDRPGFLSSYNYTQKVDLLNRILGIRIVEEANKVCSDLFKEKTKERESLEKEILVYKTTIQNAENLDFSLLEIDFDKEIKSLEEQRKNLYGERDFVNRINLLNTEIIQKKNLVKELGEVEELLDYPDFNFQIKELLEQKKKETEKLDSFRKRLNSLVKEASNFSSISDENKRAIRRLEKELEDIKISICYTCGQSLDEEKTNALKNKLFEEIEERKVKISEIENLGKENSRDKEENSKNQQTQEKALSDTISQIEAVQEKKIKLDSNKKLQEARKKAKDEYETILEERESYLQETTFNSLVLQKDTQKLSEQIETIVGKISEYSTKETACLSLSRIKEEVERSKRFLRERESSLKDLEKEISKLEKYLNLTSPKGIVISSFLDKISKVLSTDTVSVRAYKTLVNGENRPDLTADFLVGKNWLSYDQISGGQRVLVDMTILNRLLSLCQGIGLLIFDESFKFLGNQNLELVTEEIKNMACETVFIVSHVENFPLYDRIISVSLNNEEESIFSIF